VDNRAAGMVPDALRLAGVVSGDGWERTALLLLGGVDRKRPRTEIVVMDYPQKLFQEMPE
jgi:hypothetical protein